MYFGINVSIQTLEKSCFIHLPQQSASIPLAIKLISQVETRFRRELGCDWTHT